MRLSSLPVGYGWRGVSLPHDSVEPLTIGDTATSAMADKHGSPSTQTLRMVPCDDKVATSAYRNRRSGC